MIIDIGSAVLQTSTTTSSSEVSVLSGAVLLILAWVACAILIILGISTRKNRVFSLGIMAAGFMTIVTLLVYYISETLRLGVFTAVIQDFLLVAILSTLGGGIISIGIFKLIHPGFPHPRVP